MVLDTEDKTSCRVRERTRERTVETPFRCRYDSRRSAFPGVPFLDYGDRSTVVPGPGRLSTHALKLSLEGGLFGTLRCRRGSGL